MRLPLILLISLICFAATFAIAAERATIETVAGTGKPEDGGESGKGTETNIGDPFGVEIGPDGALYICEVRNHRLRRLDLKSGELTTIAGNGRRGYSGDGGPATKAELNEPYEVRFDRHGNVLFVEMKNHLVRRVDAKTGLISTIAGNGKAGFGGDGGPAKSAQLSSPHSIALDEKDNVYIADIGNHRIRRVDAQTGVISTIAGNGEKSLPVDGQIARGKPMLGPRALFIRDEWMWIALREGHSVWTMNLASGELNHVAGTGRRGYSGDGGPAVVATFDGPKGVAVGPDGSIYVVDTENHAIRKIDGKTGTITTIAGRDKMAGGTGDGGDATEALLNRPHGICVGPDGAVYIGDTLNHRVRRIR